MSTEISIKQLPAVTEVNNNDLLLVQTLNSTNTVKFENFVIGLNNTTFSSTICANSTNIDHVSSVLDDTFFTPDPVLLDGPNFLNTQSNLCQNISAIRGTEIAAAFGENNIGTTSMLPIVITNAGVRRTYYFILSAGATV